jgi:hypothetical protein
MRTAILFTLGAALALGQQHVQIERRVEVAGGGGSTVVKGAPFAAESITESVQTLLDGNRIVHKNNQKIYRDSEGRTRYEMNFAPVGAWAPAESGLGAVVIDDPVKREHFTLNPVQKTAMKIATPAGKSQEMFFHYQAATPAPAAAAGDKMLWVQEDARTVKLLHRSEAAAREVKKEALGKQVIEGLECEGTRITVTLPVGAMGNERPIDTVTEIWTSTMLKMEVLRKSKDPRSGETTYRLTAIQRGEQPRSLFEIPADYKVNEGAGYVITHKETREITK